MTITGQVKLAVDCTAGGGGHSKELLTMLPPGARLLAVDRDRLAYGHLCEIFADDIIDGRVEVIQSPFSNLKQILESRNAWEKVDLIIADLGVSSPQLDDPLRGFSFQKDGPLDMRMSHTGMTAAQFLAQTTPEELSNILRKYGEEPRAWHLAKKIVSYQAIKPFTRTVELAEFIRDNIGYRSKSKNHPATRTFQALRIHINGELQEVEFLVRDGFKALAKGGRMGIITFHSLEDRIVKQSFKAHCSVSSDLPQNLPLTAMEISQKFPTKAELIKPFPAKPSSDEVKLNPRARSAKLRVIKKL